MRFLVNKALKTNLIFLNWYNILKIVHENKEGVCAMLFWDPQLNTNSVSSLSMWRVDSSVYWLLGISGKRSFAHIRIERMGSACSGGVAIRELWRAAGYYISYKTPCVGWKRTEAISSYLPQHSRGEYSMKRKRIISILMAFHKKDILWRALATSGIKTVSMKSVPFFVQVI